MSYGDYKGSFVFANAFLEYWPFKYAGFGAGYRYVEVDIEYNPGNKTEKYDVELPGPYLNAETSKGEGENASNPD
jgi:hypothetical protein